MKLSNSALGLNDRLILARHLSTQGASKIVADMDFSGNGGPSDVVKYVEGKSNIVFLFLNEDTFTASNGVERLSSFLHNQLLKKADDTQPEKSGEAATPPAGSV